MKMPEQPDKQDGLTPVRQGMLGQTCYQVHGQGEPLVLIHGVGMGKEVWAPQIEAFAADYQVISYDMLGHGGSAIPDENVTLADYARQLYQLLTDLKISAANIVGHSMGALVALEFALTYPDKVIRLVPMNAVYCRTEAQRAAVEKRATELVMPSSDASLESTIERWFGSPVTAGLQQAEALVRRFLTSVNPTGYARTYRLFATSDRVHQGRLGQLSMPVMYLTGELDANSSPAMSAEMASETPGGRCVVLPLARHMMGITSPTETNKALADFFATTTPL